MAPTAIRFTTKTYAPGEDPQTEVYTLGSIEEAFVHFYFDIQQMVAQGYTQPISNRFDRGLCLRNPDTCNSVVIDFSEVKE